MITPFYIVQLFVKSSGVDFSYQPIFIIHSMFNLKFKAYEKDY